MTYRPARDASGDVTLSLGVQDGAGQTGGTAIRLLISPVNDDPVLTTPGTAVAEGGSITFQGPVPATGTGTGSPAAETPFFASDVDNGDDQVTALPRYGALRLGGERLGVGSVFTQNQIGRITYALGPEVDSTQVPADTFGISVQDGAGGGPITGTVPITITPVNQAPAVSGGATVYEGEADAPVPISITDRDDASHTVRITSLPADGELRLGGVTITAADVSAGFSIPSSRLGELAYSHNPGNTAVGDPPDVSFTIEVTDGGGVAATMAYTVPITVLSNDDDPVIAANTGATAPAGGSVVLTAAMLRVTDVDSAPAQLAYTITQRPALGVIVSGGRVLGTGSSFTQADIDAGWVSYRQEVVGQEPRTDSFALPGTRRRVQVLPDRGSGGRGPQPGRHASHRDVPALHHRGRRGIGQPFAP